MTENRRDFGRIALSSAIAFLAAERKSQAAVHNSQPGIKLCGQAGATSTDDELKFWKQIGCSYLSVASTPALRTADGFKQIKKRYADAGITRVLLDAPDSDRDGVLRLLDQYAGFAAKTV